MDISHSDLETISSLMNGGRHMGPDQQANKIHKTNLLSEPLSDTAALMSSACRFSPSRA